MWVDAEAGEGTRQAKVYFSEQPRAGSAHLVDRMKSAVAWEFTPGNEPMRLALSAWTDKSRDVGGLAAALPGEGACRLEVDCPYGVFHHGETSLLLHYYAKHLGGESSGDPGSFVRAKRLPLDIVPAVVGDDELTLRVEWQGKPVGGCELDVVLPGSQPREFMTDPQGTVRLPRARAGKYAVRAKYVVHEPGESGGERYAQLWHIATLTFALPAKVAADDSPTASKLLDDARRTRAVWNNFPGFTSTLTIRTDDRSQTGTFTVDSEGKITLKGLDELGKGFARQQLESLVMHRLPGNTLPTEAEYVDEPAAHVMGRSVRLAEERMGSVYRIRDHMITEVNRTMGNMRFTITVLDAFHDTEGKYLPHVFTVSFWNAKTGELESNHTYDQQWTRVGQFDLPAKLTIVSSDKKGRRVTQMIFTDLRLLTPKTASVIKP